MDDKRSDARIDTAAADFLGSALDDATVDAATAIEGATLLLSHQGARHDTGLLAEGELFALLHDSLSDAGAGGLVFALRAGHTLKAALLADGRVALRVDKRLRHNVTVADLEAAQVLPPGVGQELVTAVLDGAGAIVVGPSRTGVARVVAAVERALLDRLSLVNVGRRPMLAPQMSPELAMPERVATAMALGADVLCASGLTMDEFAALVRTTPSSPLLVGVAMASVETLVAALQAAGHGLQAAAQNIAVIGFSPSGAPRLCEMHGPTRSPAPEDEPAADDETAAPTDAELPSKWAKAADVHDPGWELQNEPVALAVRGPVPPPVEGLSARLTPHALRAKIAAEPAAKPGSFAASLMQQKQAPAFSPQPPAAHPQHAHLRQAAVPAAVPGAVRDPFGGLTFGPPSSSTEVEGFGLPPLDDDDDDGQAP